MSRSQGDGRSSTPGRRTGVIIAAWAIVIGSLCPFLASIVLPVMPGSPDWIVMNGVPWGLATVTTIGTLARRRWGYVAARWLGAFVVVVCGVACLLLVVGGLVATVLGGGVSGDAAPPAWVLSLIGLGPGLIAGAAFGLHRVSTSLLRAWHAPADQAFEAVEPPPTAT